MGFVIGALKVIILLGSLIMIHEFGHFIVAKACGMKVLKFSIGFGPKLFSKQGKETEYSLRVLPLGGFVQLEGEDEESADPRSFSKKPAWQRILVLLAGVAINIIVAVLIYISINMNTNIYLTSTIEEIPASNKVINNDLNEVLKAGQTINKINGIKIYNAYDVSEIISKAESNEFLFEIKEETGEKREFILEIPKEKIGYIGVAFSETIVHSVLENSAGEKAGLKANDKILSMDGIRKETIDEYLTIIQSHPNQKFEIEVERDKKIIQLEIIPEVVEKRNFELDFLLLSDLSFGENLYYAVNETLYYLRMNFVGIGELFKGKTENVEVEGIVGISQQISNTEHITEFFYLMSAISLSLGIMNLLPIPGLDGGKIFFTLIEIIRRKPISREVEGTLTLAGFGVLILLMIVVTVGDIANLFS